MEESLLLPQFESEFEQNLYRQRQEKLEQLTEIGQRLGLSRLESIYPNRFPSADEPLTLAQIPDLIGKYDDTNAPATHDQLEAEKPEFAVAGRLMSHRLQGKAGFAHLQGGGKRLQIYIRKDDLGPDPETRDAVFALYKLLDLGDHIGVRGTLMRTRTGELTLKALPLGGRPAISFLAKAMLALPDKYHGLEDVELRYRQRYVDLIMNSGTLAKAEVPTLPGSAPTIEVLSRPERSEVERPAVQSGAPQTLGAPPSPAASSPVRVGSEAPANPEAQLLPPGTGAVTDTSAPNEEHDDAPLNVREVFVKRAAILRAIRKFLDARGYLEVETPMLHTVAGGAAAKPFKTHHNALDIPLSLRIAPELFLKRLVVGGLDRVYEINRNFRNEGVSTRHNPEFTMLEFYQAYANYHDLMELTQEMVEFVAMEVNGSTVTHFSGETIELATQNWTKLSMREAIVNWWPSDMNGPRPSLDTFSNESHFARFLKAHSGQSGTGQVSSRKRGPDGNPIPSALQAADIFGFRLTDLQISLEGEVPVGRIISDLFEHLTDVLQAVGDPKLIQPTIIYDFPLAVSPLSKVKPDEPDWVERFEFYIGGFEVGNAFSELNDPEDQRRRFEAQLEQKERGDEEAMAAVDEDYVRALGYGLPPTAGEGIGIDRLTMLLTGSRSIRDVILFPLMRPRAEAAPQTGEAQAHSQSAE